ncbi:hypothetical protein SLS57_002886 [Botryosphaeria dothidea]
MTENQKQDQNPQVGNRSKDVPWYSKDIQNATPQARELLEKYSNIPPEKVDAHLLEVRDKAWEIFPYPCIGMFRFLDLNMCNQPYYPEVLERVKNGEKILDIGCCFGQELRKLAHDGAPVSSLYGSDIRPEFLSLGHTLFLDEATLPLDPHFLAADILSPSALSATPLAPLASRISIVHASSFFHLFPRADQLRAALRLVELLVPEPGATVVGRQVGSPEPGPRGEHGRWMHDAASWRALWDEVGESTGSRWEVKEARLEQADLEGVSPELLKARGGEWAWWLRWWVVRVE